MVFALGRIELVLDVPTALFAIEFLRTFAVPPAAALLVLSRLDPRWRDAGKAVM